MNPGVEFSFDVLLTGPGLLSLLSLSAMEVVLGIDNIVFLSILTGKLPPSKRQRARRLGLSLALVLRITLLFTISWVMGLNRDLFHLGSKGVTGRDLIMFFGGLFLLVKSSHELYEKVQSRNDTEEDVAEVPVSASSGAVILVQIAFFDLVFSLDSIITAVGMTTHVEVMIGATVFAVACMMMFAGVVGDFIVKNPGMKILALVFLLVVGGLLVAEAFALHVPRVMVYFAMGFAIAVELLNMRYRSRKGIPANQQQAQALAASANATRTP